jgi:hypothetical protein
VIHHRKPDYSSKQRISLYISSSLCEALLASNVLAFPGLSIEPQIIVTGYHELPIPHKRILRGHLLLAEHPTQAILRKGSHLRDLVVAECAHPEARGDGDVVHEVEVVEVVVGVVLVLADVVFYLVAVSVFALWDVFLWVGET